MPQERTFQMTLKNDQPVEFKFTSIAATGDRLFQMFATAEALDALQQLIEAGDAAGNVEVDTTETKSARKTAPAAPATDAVKPVAAKKKKAAQ